MSVELRRGRQKKARQIFEVAALTREDFAKLKETHRVPLVQKFRDTHHRLARLMALGLRTQEVAERSGYSRSRILMFSSDPAFQELVETYRKDAREGFKEGVADYMEVATSNMMMAEVMVKEQLEDAMESGEKLPIRELLHVSRDAADRFGFGKHQTQTNVNIDFASRLEDAIRARDRVANARLVEGEVARAPVTIDAKARSLPAPLLPAKTKGPTAAPSSFPDDDERRI